MPKAAASAATVTFLVSVAIASASPAAEQTATPMRVTIRGTGKDVRIVRVGALPSGRADRPSSGARATIREAVRIKTQGFDDEALLSYLRAHEADLPLIVDADQVRLLRRAGAGESVMGYLSSVAALDIGETGEGGPPAPALEPSAETGSEGGDGMAYGYPVGSGYPIGGYGAFRARGFGLHGFPRPKRFPFHPGRPGFPRPFPRHPSIPHRPMPRW